MSTILLAGLGLQKLLARGEEATTPTHCALSGPVLRDTARLSQRYPPIARYGVFGVATWPIGRDTPSPFSERFPMKSMQSGGAIPPLKRGISAILARYPMKTRQMLDGHMIRLHLGKVHRRTSKKFSAFLEALFSLIL